LIIISLKVEESKSTIISLKTIFLSLKEKEKLNLNFPHLRPNVFVQLRKESNSNSEEKSPSLKLKAEQSLEKVFFYLKAEQQRSRKTP
jgi:hypothetical protein